MYPTDVLHVMQYCYGLTQGRELEQCPRPARLRRRRPRRPRRCRPPSHRCRCSGSRCRRRMRAPGYEPPAPVFGARRPAASATTPIGYPWQDVQQSEGDEDAPLRAASSTDGCGGSSPSRRKGLSQNGYGLRNSASGPDIGLPGRIFGRPLLGKTSNRPSGRPSADKKGRF